MNYRFLLYSRLLFYKHINPYLFHTAFYEKGVFYFLGFERDFERGLFLETDLSFFCLC
jgi:hypothetical protein